MSEVTPCTTCNGSALVGICGLVEFGEVCVMRSGHSGPCWHESDVASDWAPASSCVACCVCPCGYTDFGDGRTEPCIYCHQVMRPGVKATKDPATHKVVFG